MSSFDDFPPPPGTTLDERFVVEGTLGSGGMGAVVAAKHLGLRRLVAIKLLKPRFAQSPQVVSRFLREARTAARLKSEHVVTVLDVGTLASGLPYFVMDYLPGTDLGALVQKQGPLAVDDVVGYALQTLETLAEAHRAGIVHRDLKPPNLFLTTREDGSGLIKVLDFGISKLIGWEVTDDGIVTREGAALGSPLYMSPEQIRDASRVDGRADIWALGAVMHELLTGRPPFDHQGVPRVIRAICSERYRVPERSDVPDELHEILFQCLRKDRKERFQDVEELARAFQPLVRSASAGLSIERILRTRGGTPSVRAAAIPEPALGTDPEPRFPSVAPVERDTPPSIPIRGAFWLGARAGVAAGVVWAAFVLGSYLARDERPSATTPAAAGANIEKTAVNVAPALPNGEKPMPKVGTAVPNVEKPTPSIVPAASVAPVAPSAPSAVEARAPVARNRNARRAKNVAPAHDSPWPAVAAPSPPPSDTAPTFVTIKARRLDPENPFVTKP